MRIGLFSCVLRALGISYFQSTWIPVCEDDSVITGIPGFSNIPKIFNIDYCYEEQFINMRVKYVDLFEFFCCKTGNIAQISAVMYVYQKT